jgi:hypothetical protein
MYSKKSQTNPFIRSKAIKILNSERTIRHVLFESPLSCGVFLNIQLLQMKVNDLQNSLSKMKMKQEF